jgi:hypothetical protein
MFLRFNCELICFLIVEMSRTERNNNLENHQQCADIVNEIERLTNELLDKVGRMSYYRESSHKHCMKIYQDVKNTKHFLDDKLHKIQTPPGFDRDRLKFIYYRGSR